VSGYHNQFVTVDNYRIAYRTEGNPTLPPLVMVHGWLSYGGVWDTTAQALRDTHFCIMIDLLGYGYSDKPPAYTKEKRVELYGIPQQARRVLAVADALKLDKFAITGHSMGGQIAVYLAVNAPKRINKVISVSGVVTGNLSAYNRYITRSIIYAALYVPAVWSFARYATPRFAWYREFNQRPLYYEKALQRAFSRNNEFAMLPGIETPAIASLEAIEACPLVDQLGEVRQPTLVVFGKHDGTVPVENAEIMQRNVPNCTLSLLDSCSHVPMEERFDAYIAPIRTFLQ
jgi:pimeloyl-ACP methyl ester carboxylesterase